MKRFPFIASLLGLAGIAKAQSTNISDRMRSEMAVSSPVNNKCPVCGTMAEPFKRPMAAQPDGKGFWADRPYGPTQNIARCKRCNCAFWQNE